MRGGSATNGRRWWVVGGGGLEPRIQNSRIPVNPLEFGSDAVEVGCRYLSCPALAPKAGMPGLAVRGEAGPGTK